MNKNIKLDEEIQEFLEKLTEDAKASQQLSYSLKVGEYKSYLDLKNKDNAFKKAVLVSAIRKANVLHSDSAEEAVTELYDSIFISTCHSLVSTLLRSNLDYAIDELLALFEFAKKYENFLVYWFPVGLALNHLEKAVKKGGLTEEQQTSLKNIQSKNLGYGGADAKNKLKIKEILAQVQGKSIGEVEPILLDDEDEVGKRINAQITTFDSDKKIAYYQFLALLKKSTQGKPTGKFYQEVDRIAQLIGKQSFASTIRQWLIDIKKVSPIIQRHTQNYTNHQSGETHEYSYTAHSYLKESTLVFVKGLVWGSLAFADKEMTQYLATFAEHCFKKIPSKGPLAMGVGNACIYVLSRLGLEGVSYLSRLKLHIRQASTQTLIENYIRTSAEALGVTPAEIEDKAAIFCSLSNLEYSNISVGKLFFRQKVTKNFAPIG